MRSKDQVDAMNDIIQGISRRSAYKFKNKSVEDISQDLWLKILCKEKELGHDIDLNLTAKICFDEIVSMQRYELRRNHYSLDSIQESEFNKQSNLFETPDNCTRLIIQDLFKIFPKDSKEYIFIEYWANASGYFDSGVTGDGQFCGGYVEKDLAKKLGYPSSDSNGYRRFRNKMRIFVAEYIK